MLATQLRAERARLESVPLLAFFKRHLRAGILLKQLDDMTEHARQMEAHYNSSERERSLWMFKYSDVDKKLRELERGRRS